MVADPCHSTRTASRGIVANMQAEAGKLPVAISGHNDSRSAAGHGRKLAVAISRHNDSQQLVTVWGLRFGVYGFSDTLGTVHTL